MSFDNSNYITNLLSIPDKNITLSDKITKEVIAKRITIVLHGTLTYTPEECPCCSNRNASSIIKHGTKETIVRLLPINGEPAALRLKKQRFLCKACGHNFSADTDLVEKYHSISNRTRLHILSFLVDKISEKDIAKQNYVSHSTVSRYIDRDFESYSPSRFKLPKNMSFDEFKSTKDAKGAMSFIVTDLNNKEILDIVENRQIWHLINYFRRFTKKARHSVKTITIDMYKPYITLIKTLFPNAEIIFDRFHVINNLSRALLKTRIDAMKKLPTQSMEFKRLKRYWRLIQMDWDKLDTRDFKHFSHFKEIQTEYGVVRQSIEVNELLQETYEIYQFLLKAIQDGDSERLRKLLNLFKNQGSRYIQTAIKTMLDNYKYVENALIYPYSNGFTEGMNNYIKVLKRVAFGYKSFFHFRNRILIARKLKVAFKL